MITKPHSDEELIAMARACLQVEMDALKATTEGLDASFSRVVRQLSGVLASGGKLIFSGVGKNAPICQKIVATANSTGSLSVFLDPVGAQHGDLGLTCPGDIALLFSNSGETEEIVALIPILRRLEVRTIGVTSRPGSRLATLCDDALSYSADKEACPLNLAPTASTTAALALGDAVAMTLLQVREFRREDFARYHPAGSLGKVLILKVDDIMRSGDHFACASDRILVRDAILAITQAKSGIVALTDDSGALSGVFSDGDFRRCAIAHADVLARPVGEFMTRKPTTIAQGSMVADALRIFQARNFNDLIVVDAAGKPLGVIDSQDLPKLKIV